jgi:hypothetical protein
MKRSLPGTPARGNATTKLLGRLGALAVTCGLLSIAVAGCAGSLDPGVTGGGGAGGGSGGGCEVALIMTKCVPCHASVGNSGGLDLQSANIASRLVGAPSFAGDGAMCPNKTLLDAGSNPATGLFIDKITNDPPSCGFVMPYGQKMGAPDIACLTTWATTLTSGSP